MPVSFRGLAVGVEYSRPALADLWGYADWHAIGSGIVTPRGLPFVVLFVTAEKQASLEQYDDSFDGWTLRMDGQIGHGTDDRLIASPERDEVHLFWRHRHHRPFVYCGEVKLVDHVRSQSRGVPSRFFFETLEFVETKKS